MSEPQVAQPRSGNLWTRLAPQVRGALILSLIGAVLVGITWGAVNAGDDSARSATVAQTGRVTESDGSAVFVEGAEDYTTSFVLPGGVIGVEAELGAADSDYDPDVVAPKGGVLLRASLRRPYDNPPLELPSEPVPGLDPARLPTSRIWVRNGDVRTRLFDDVRTPTLDDDRLDEMPAVTVALPDADGPIELELEFDGKRQRVDLRSGKRTVGAFAALYRPVVSRNRSPGRRAPW